MSRFLEALRSGRVLLMDGAMGTELRRAGLGECECAELWNLTRPDLVRAIHEAYVTAGARCLITNTFQSNPPALERHGLRPRLGEINQAAVKLARKAGGLNCFVLADIGPLEKGASDETFLELVSSFPGADALLLETCSSEADLIGLKRAQELQPAEERLPVLFSVAYRRGTGGGVATINGTGPAELAVRVQGHGVAALGANCGRDIRMEDLLEITHRYRGQIELPLFARPNAGTPVLEHAALQYPDTPTQMARGLPALLEAGARMVGGCCGTTPEHIRVFGQAIAEWEKESAG